MIKRDSLYSIDESSQNSSSGKLTLTDKNPFKVEEKQEYDNLEFSLQVLDLARLVNSTLKFVIFC